MKFLSMKKLLIILHVLLSTIILSAQDFEDITFGADTTFEVLTWNIEWFPKNGQTTIDYVKEIIRALDVDLLAIQEVDDISSFEQLVDSLDGYAGYLESSWFAGLAYIYKTDVIQINEIYEIYITEPYWSPFPRSPMVMDLNFKNERIIIINNHFKCCGDGILDLENPDDEEYRRLYASNLLKLYIETHFDNIRTIVLGDLNDILTDDPENNVFQMFLDEPENYYFTDYIIAEGDDAQWSYPSWPSHLDHILITNELYSEFEHDSSEIKTIRIDAYISGGWWEYESNISDHRPVALRLMIDQSVGVSDFKKSRPLFSNYPNPFSSQTTFLFKNLEDNAEIKIYNVKGENVFSEQIAKEQASLTWNAEGFPNGIYFARLIFNHIEIAHSKLILLR